VRAASKADSDVYSEAIVLLTVTNSNEPPAMANTSVVVRENDAVILNDTRRIVAVVSAIDPESDTIT